MDLNCGINCASGVYAVPDGTRILSTISLPGTAVPGYRLFRPYGTGPARFDIVPFYRRLMAIHMSGSAVKNTVLAWRTTH
jgi:hypothetical protein